MPFRVFDRDFANAVIALAGSGEFDSGRDETLIDAVDVVDDEPDPGSETSCLLLPVRHGSIQPDLTIANGELHVADDPVVVGPSFALNETEDLDTPIGDGASIDAEHIRDDASNSDVGHSGSFQLVGAPVDSPDHNGSIMDIDARRQQLIGLVESFPDVAAEVGGDADQHVGFAVRTKRFAWYLDDHHCDEIVALTCKAPPGVNTELAAQEPDRFFIPSYSGKRGWLGVRLDLPTLDWEEIAELVEDAYRMTAPRSLLVELDERRTLGPDQ